MQPLQFEYTLMQPPSKETFSFPSKEIITETLQKELAKNEIEVRIIHAVADFFANRQKSKLGIQVGIMCTVDDLTESQGMLPTRAQRIKNELETAILQCAKAHRLEGKEAIKPKKSAS